MNCARHQAQGKTIDAEVLTPKYDVANSIVVRQHADDDLAFEQVADIRCGLETDCRQLAHPVRPTYICDHPISGGGKVCGHHRAHVTETDKADCALHQRAVV
jgi:hypothetical protein